MIGIIPTCPIILAAEVGVMGDTSHPIGNRWGDRWYPHIPYHTYWEQRWGDGSPTISISSYWKQVVVMEG